MYKSILYSVHKGIATITLNRPEVLNAFHDEMLEELLDAYERVDEDDAVRIVIVTGSGRAFCAGSDLSHGGDTFVTDANDYRDTGGQLSLRVYRLKKPIIAAINGAAVGVGLTMTLPMDIRVVSKGAKLGFVFARRGIGPEACSGWFLPKLVGIGKALEWVLTGRMLSTEEAVVNGLVQIEADDAFEAAHQLAQEIIQNSSSVSTSFSRTLFWNMLGTTCPEESHLAESRFLQWAGCRADAKEGIQSFIEKRKPDFKMPISSLPNFIDKTTKEG